MFEEFHGIPLANDSTICDPFMALKVLLGGISCLVGALFECALLFEFFVVCMYLRKQWQVSMWFFRRPLVLLVYPVLPVFTVLPHSSPYLILLY